MQTLREAAETAGVSKTTLWRAVKAGRLSATRDELGGFAIDPAELARVFPAPAPPQRHMEQRETPPDDLVTRLAVAEAELAGLKALLAEVRGHRDAMTTDRDEWKHRAERLLAPPAARPWWRRSAG